VLDIYVGSFSRYFSGNWETAMQSYCREQNIPYERRNPLGDDQSEQNEECLTDPEELREIVYLWRNQLKSNVPMDISAQLNWIESPNTPYWTRQLGFDFLSDLIRWASHTDNPSCPPPIVRNLDWSSDPAYQKSSDLSSDSCFRNLLLPEVWLPENFNRPFQAEDIPGNQIYFGSAPKLLAELSTLSEMTWQSSLAELNDWWKGFPGGEVSLQQGAKIGCIILCDMAAIACREQVPMMLDY
jgi:hypothetical protein